MKKMNGQTAVANIFDISRGEQRNPLYVIMDLRVATD